MSAKPVLHLLMLLFCSTSLLTAAQQSEETPQQSYDQEPQIEPHYSSAAGRERIVYEILSARNKAADPLLIEDIVMLTEAYDDKLVKDVVHFLATEYELAFLERALSDQFLAEAIYEVSPDRRENGQEAMGRILHIVERCIGPERDELLYAYAPEGAVKELIHWDPLGKDKRLEVYIYNIFKAYGIVAGKEFVALLADMFGGSPEWLIKAMLEHMAQAPEMHLLMTDICMKAMGEFIQRFEDDTGWRKLKLQRIAQIRNIMAQIVAEEAAYPEGMPAKNINGGQQDSNQEPIAVSELLAMIAAQKHLLRTILREHHKVAREPFLDAMTTLMAGYQEEQVRKIIKQIAMVSDDTMLNEQRCLDIIAQAIQYFDSDLIIREKKLECLAQVEQSIKQAQARSVEPDVEVKYDARQMPEQEPMGACKSSAIQRYPLLRDVYHLQEVKLYFKDAIEQLQQGHFRNDFRRGILLYGPPGVGKGEMVEAMINESGCTVYRIKASELVERYQGSGAQAIKELFAKAKAGPEEG